MNTFDIIIVGNGILGLSTAHALALQNHNLSIAVIGPAAQPGCATTAAGAMLGCFGEVTKYTYQSEQDLKKLELAVNAKRLWPSWLESINTFSSKYDQLAVRKGTFIILNSRSGALDSENYQAIHDTLISYNEDFEEVEPKHIPFLNPITDFRPLQAMYLPHEGYLNAKTLLSHLQHTLRSCSNIHLLNDEVIKINTQSNQVQSVCTKTDILSGKTIILAAGAFSQNILDTIPSLAFKIPRIFAGIGCSVTLELPGHKLNHVIRSPNRAGGCGIHAMGYDANTLYVGATNHIDYSPKNHTQTRYAYYLLQYAMEQVNQRLHNADILQWSTGCRPVSLDTFPLFGETSISGLWLLSGTYRDGLHLSPLIAQGIAKKLLGSTDPWVGDFFPAERPPIQTMTPLQSIEHYVQQSMASGYEHGMHLPRNGWDEQLPDLIRTRARQLYSELNCDYGLPAEILLMIDRDPQLIPSIRQYLHSTNYAECST